MIREQYTCVTHRVQIAATSKLYIYKCIEISTKTSHSRVSNEAVDKTSKACLRLPFLHKRNLEKF